MLYRSSYASVLRREIVYYNPESSRCKAFPYATESTRVSEATVSAPPARQLNVSNHTASRSVRARVWAGKSGARRYSGMSPARICAAGPIHSRPAWERVCELVPRAFGRLGEEPSPRPWGDEKLALNGHLPGTVARVFVANGGGFLAGGEALK